MKINFLIMVYVSAIVNYGALNLRAADQESAIPVDKIDIKVEVQFLPAIDSAVKIQAIPIVVTIVNNFKDDVCLDQSDQRNNGIVILGIDETGKKSELFPDFSKPYISDGPMKIPTLGLHTPVGVDAKIPLGVINHIYKSTVWVYSYWSEDQKVER